jgi:xylulokinase
LIVGGGGIQSAPWIQAIADSVGIPVLVQDSPFGAAMGAAFLARMAIGLEDSLESAGRWFRVEKTVEPAEDWREAIDSRYGRYRQLVELTSG